MKFDPKTMIVDVKETDMEDPRFPCIDYVLVYSALNLDLQTPRDLFEQAMLRDGLKLEKETMGNNVFLKITCPFDRLALQAERINLEMPIKGNVMTTDDEVDFVSAPFEVAKFHLYEGNEDKNTFFRPALRCYLVHNILINLDIKDYLKREFNEDEDDLISKRGLLYLSMKKAYTDAFILHDPSAEEPYYLKIKEKSLEDYYLQIPKTATDARRDMNATWVKFWKFQPLWKIRNYFGEKIAFYFAWEGTFVTLLWIPAFLGFIIFVYGLTLSFRENKFKDCKSQAGYYSSSANTSSPSPVQSTVTPECNSIAHYKQLGEDVLGVIKESFDNMVTPFFSLIICLWGTLFLEIWKRNNYTLAYQWDVNSYEHAEPDRPEFFGTKQKPDPITGELAWFYPISKRFRKYFISAVVSVLMICLVFVSVCAVVAYKVVIRYKFSCVGDGEEEADRASRTAEGNPLVCLFLATVVPAVLNAVSILILGTIYTKIAEKLTFWENHRTQTEFNDALIIKLFAFQFANTYTSLFYIAFFRPIEHGFQSNGVFGWGEKYRDTCRSTTGHCMSLLSFQILVLMIIKPFPKFFKDIVIPWLFRKYRRLKRMMRKTRAVADLPENTDNNRPDSKSDEPELTVNNFLEREFLKPKLTDFTMGEYTEKVIQFGYIVMFAASFPLAPFLALIINLFDLRVDAKRLLWLNRRPVAFIASHIGIKAHP